MALNNMKMKRLRVILILCTLLSTTDVTNAASKRTNNGIGGAKSSSSSKKQNDRVQKLSKMKKKTSSSSSSSDKVLDIVPNARAHENSNHPSPTSPSAITTPFSKNGRRMRMRIIGTRITGVGSHSSNRYRSIFQPKPAKKKSGLRAAIMGKDRRGSTATGANNNGYQSISSVMGERKKKMYTKISHDGKLLFYFPSCSGSSQEIDDPSDNNDEAIPCNGKVISLTNKKDDLKQAGGDMIHAEFVDMGESDDIFNGGIEGESSPSSWSSRPWIPIEGIFGVYMLPSGPHLVLISETGEVYKSGDGVGSNGNGNADSQGKASSSSSLINLRRILSMEIVRVPEQNGRRHRHRLPNEKRQFHVLRQSLKEHEFYYVPQTQVKGNQIRNGHSGSIVQDITHNLQRSFLHWAVERKSMRMSSINTSTSEKENNDLKVNVNGVGMGVGNGGEDVGKIDISSENRTGEESLENESVVLQSNVTAITNTTKVVDNEASDEGQGWWSNLSSKFQTKSVNGDESLSEESGSAMMIGQIQTPFDGETSILGDEVEIDDQTTNSNSNSTAVNDTSNHGKVIEKSWWTALIRSEERTQSQPKDSKDAPTSMQRPDSRFFWNEDTIKPFLQSLERCKDDDEGEESSLPYKTLLDHIIPVTSAFIGVQRNITLVPNAKSNTVFGVKYDQLLISRRSKYRAGTRFTRRGADAAGDVANFAETEQICIIYDNDIGIGESCKIQELYSHTQTRGSIPIRWSSPTDIKTYRPKVMIGTDPLAQARALRSHLVEQLLLYSDLANKRSREDVNLVFVNLIDKHSDQGRLGRTFSAVLDAVLSAYNDCEDEKSDNVAILLNPTSISHIWYDFHAECKGGRWDRLKYLLEDVRQSLDSQGYFCATPKNGSDWEIKGIQNGSIRTNCMDCLDRTNVVQSMFGRYILYQQFSKRIGLEQDKPKRTLPIKMNLAFKRNMLTLPWDGGEIKHRMLWADNADAISRLYAGTPALKGDFTRTGKRTKRGALDDGVNSLTRFYLNNFIDADRQEGMDLLTGFADFDTTETDDDLLPSQASRNLRRKKSWGVLEQRMKEIAKRERFKSMTVDSRLNLTWLPGDLQSHLRSAALSTLSAHDEGILVDTSNQVSLSTALRDIDRRSMLDYPWWVTEDSSSDEEEKDSEQIVSFKTSTNNFAIGALIASVKAPISSAFAFICFMAPGIFRFND